MTRDVAGYLMCRYMGELFGNVAVGIGGDMMILLLLVNGFISVSSVRGLVVVFVLIYRLILVGSGASDSGSA